MARRGKRRPRGPAPGNSSEAQGPAAPRETADEPEASDDWSLVAPNAEDFPDLPSSPTAQARLREALFCDAAADEAAGVLAEALWSKKNGYRARAYLEKYIEFLEHRNQPINSRLRKLLTRISP